MTDKKREELRGDIEYFLALKDHMKLTKEGREYGRELLEQFPIDDKSTLEDIDKAQELMEFIISNL